MITGFANKETQKVWLGEVSKRLPRDIQESARDKMRVLHRIVKIEELWAFPSYKAEKLSKDRKGQWSIRINNQWRICFVWNPTLGEASAVEIADYH